MIGLSPSTYYHRPKRSRESRERGDAELRDAIEAVQADFPKAGYRTVQRYLRQIPDERINERVIPNRDRSLRLMGHHVFRICEAFLKKGRWCLYNSGFLDPPQDVIGW